MLLSELTIKDVINDHDGVKIGKISDLEIDSMTGRILSVKINSGFKLGNVFSSRNNTTVAWNRIIKIGSDVIIIDNDNKVSKES